MDTSYTVNREPFEPDNVNEKYISGEGPDQKSETFTFRAAVPSLHLFQLTSYASASRPKRKLTILPEARTAQRFAEPVY